VREIEKRGEAGTLAVSKLKTNCENQQAKHQFHQE